ncbi:tRNA dihydrouridine synthase A [Vittaforma corneae ATCC 50505]|uniref:tRNA dihydrouridine synthase A n=1 Tax=Vittaforma corneae (strain ATCC 50505) TaxID=993615 RepID=L2GMM1_VITCO|nr:tRNA dihydrouridine synthase A [Vittaforma corneae ATCC 50505]ELA41884.1 tRNA dihydrouridine synthase A [Vittaforma corneae ATCC 50505]
MVIEISLAPMLKITTPYFRMLIRKTSPDVVLFTEMIVSSTVVNVTNQRLQFILGSPEDKTVVQIGGSNPEEIAESVKILQKMGWRRFNLNCGCPSDRVQSGKFGAILMLEKERVAEIVNAVHNNTGAVLSLKIRTGVDENDSFEFFKDFIRYISENTPCFRFYVHARKCWLHGLNPKQNRNVPPLAYQYVYDIKALFPHLFISLNGGIREDGMEIVRNLDGIMIGRHAWDNVRIFVQMCSANINMKQVVKEYIEEASKLEPPKYRLMMPLINYRKGRSLNKVFKQIVNNIIQNDTPYSEIYSKLEPYID